MTKSEKIHELEVELDNLYERQKRLSDESTEFFINMMKIMQIKSQLTALDWKFDDDGAINKIMRDEISVLRERVSGLPTREDIIQKADILLNGLKILGGIVDYSPERVRKAFITAAFYGCGLKE
jgi:hypothetical protein